MSYHTGCDIHRNTCVFQHMDDDGALGLYMRVSTDKDAINKFLEHLDEATTMTFEAGRNYWWLHEFFNNHPKVSEVNVVDPRRSKNIAEELSVLSGYGRARNDRIDGEMLADQTRRGLAPTIHVPTFEQLERRDYHRQRFELMTAQTRAKNTIHAKLAQHGVSAKIADLLSKPEVKEKITQLVPCHISFIVNQLLVSLKLYTQQIVDCEQALDKVLPASHPQIKLLLTVPGIGMVIARIIICEILDIGYFKEPKYLISYSGLAPFEKDSDGQRKGIIKLNRHCNYYLKYAFVEAAHGARSHPKYRRKYELDVKKHGKIIAKLNLARRLAKTVYWMLTRQQPFKE